MLLTEAHATDFAQYDDDANGLHGQEPDALSWLSRNEKQLSCRVNIRQSH